MTPPVALEADVERPWRCDVTGNPVGTDTRMIGAPPCDCQGCRAADRIAVLAQQLRDETAENARNAEGFAFHAARAERERARAEAAEARLAASEQALSLCREELANEREANARLIRAVGDADGR